jgi:CRISPR/Cas system CSM-associated protein Csm3 (group 7 of RAMP superfamily)
MRANDLGIKDSGRVRTMVARWVITGDMILESAAHFGGPATPSSDMAVLRDPKEGVPLLPGTSIAGALRSYLANYLGGYGSVKHPLEDSKVSTLFGTPRADESGPQSPLIVFDSLGKLPDGLSIEIRDGVSIAPEHGTAETGKKFDMEVLPAGTIFPLRFELIVEGLDKEPDLLSLLVAALSGLTKGEISLGARRSRGLGAVCIHKWKALRHDLTSQEGWLDWLLSDAQHPIPDDTPSLPSVREACIKAYPGPLTFVNFEDERNRIVAVVTLSFRGGLLVRSPAATAEAPDAVHLCSGGQSVLPGTSLAGVLRNRATRIARLVRNNHEDGEEWVKNMFGPRLEGRSDPDFRPAASRLRVSESILNDGTRLRPTRIRIDRFTQGVARGALFEEEPHYDGKVMIRMVLRDPQKGETGLFLLILKDLLSGDINVGGAGSVGRGVPEGVAAIQLKDGKTIQLKPGASPETPDDKEWVDSKINEFWECETLREQSERETS